jgi:hypothetical protein
LALSGELREGSERSYNFPMKSRTRLIIVFAAVTFLVLFSLTVVGGILAYRWHNRYPAIPQDPAYHEQLTQKRSNHIQGVYRDSFLKIGKRNPNWDKSALAAVESASKFFIDTYNPPVPLTEVYAAAKAAVDAGCDDPLILHLLAYGSAGTNTPENAEYDRRWVAAQTAMMNSTYPAEIRFTACVRAGLARLNNKSAGNNRRIEARGYLDQAMVLLPSIMESDASPRARQEWYEHCRSMRRFYQATGLSRSQAYDRIDDTLAQTPNRRAQRLIQQASRLIDEAWESRGSGVAATVTADGFDGFIQSLIKARTVLEEAWQLDPADAKSATLMIQVEIGIGEKRAEMEKWFDRAMRADNDNETACRLKMDWLDPKWHGSIDDLLDFGRACRDTGNWSTGIPLLLAEAHYRVARMTRMHFADQAVANELIATYEAYLQHRPNNNYVRSEFAGVCYWCEHFDEANREFQRLGKQLTATEWFTSQVLESARSESAEKAAKQRKN